MYREELNTIAIIVQSDEEDLLKNKYCDFSKNQELHINLWDITNEKKKDFCYLDIGLMLNPFMIDKSIIIKFPKRFKIRNGVKDLYCSSNHKKNRDIILAIFNDEISNDKTKKKDYNNYQIFYLEERGIGLCYLRLLEKEEHESKYISYKNDYCARSSSYEIKIKIKEEVRKAIKDIDAFYLRFRIVFDRNECSNIFSEKIEPKDKNLLSSYLSTELTEMRINVRRDITPDLYEEIFLPLGKINYFYICNANKENVCNNENYLGFRSLSNEDIWKDYIDLTIGDDKEKMKDFPKNYVGYQWKIVNDKESAHIKDAIFLGKFVEKKSTYLNVIIFLLIATLISILGGAILNFLSNSRYQLVKNILTIIGDDPNIIIYSISIISIIIFWQKIISCFLLLINKVKKKK